MVSCRWPGDAERWRSGDRVGFIGAGLTFGRSMRDHEVLRGITTGAAILAAAAIGAAGGDGLFLVAVLATVLVILALEIRRLPVLMYLAALAAAIRVS